MFRWSPALLSILVWMLAPTALFSAGDAGAGDQAHGFLIVEGRVVTLGSESGEGGLDLVTATLRTATGSLSVGLAPESVFRQTGFPLQEGDDVVIRLFQESGGILPPAQMVQNRTRNRAIRLRSILREPLWDGKGIWQGGFCTHRIGARHASRR